MSILCFLQRLYKQQREGIVWIVKKRDMNKKRKKNVCCIYVFSIMSIRFTRIICCCYLRATTLLASVVSSSVAVFIARFLRKMATTAVVLTLTTDRMTPLSFASRTYSFRVDCEALQSRLLLTRRQREKSCYTLHLVRLRAWNTSSGRIQGREGVTGVTFL